MRPQSCKSKGRRLQQKVAADIRDAFPHLGEDDCHSTPMGAPGEDVRLSAAARACVRGLSIECKNVEKLNVWACLQQCETNAPDGTTPCLVFTRNRHATYAVLPWPKLVALCKSNRRGALPPRVAGLARELAAALAEAEAAEAEAEAGAEGSATSSN